MSVTVEQLDELVRVSQEAIGLIKSLRTDLADARTARDAALELVRVLEAKLLTVLQGFESGKNWTGHIILNDAGEFVDAVPAAFRDATDGSVPMRRLANALGDGGAA